MKRLNLELERMEQEGWYYDLAPWILRVYRYKNHSCTMYKLNLRLKYFSITHHRTGKIIDDLQKQYSYVKDYDIQEGPDRIRSNLLDAIVRSKGATSSKELRFWPRKTAT